MVWHRCKAVGLLTPLHMLLLFGLAEHGGATKGVIGASTVDVTVGAGQAMHAARLAAEPLACLLSHWPLPLQKKCLGLFGLGVYILR